jgi:sarcosine oxidase
VQSSGKFDVVVVGCGAAGSAAAWWCARRGLRVLAVDRFEPGHRRGSSHGTERIVRLGHTDPAYVELAIAALAGWGELEDAAHLSLLSRTGALDFGLPTEIEEIARVTAASGLRVELLADSVLRQRYPALSVTGAALFQPDGGTVHADRALSVLRNLAQSAGAEMRSVEEVLAVEQLEHGVSVRTAGHRWEASTAIVTTGAWAPALLAGIVELPEYRVTQEQLAFFHPRERLELPAFISRTQPRRYGMVTPEGLLKVAEHHTGPVVHPDQRTYDIEPTSWGRLGEWVRETLPGVDPEPVDSATCLYASTPDEDFVIDRVGDVVVGVGLSGHGFKFIPEIGRRLADLAVGAGWPGNPFAVQRTPRHTGESGHK